MPWLSLTVPPLSCAVLLSSSSGGRARPGRCGSRARGVDHEYLGRADDAVTDAVAGLGDHLRRGHLHVGILADVAERRVEVRVERVTRLAVLDQTGRRHDPLQLLGNGGEAGLELPVLAGPVDRVEHVDDRGERGVRRVLAHQLTVTVDPALVVEVLGLEALQVGGALGQRLQRRSQHHTLGRCVHLRLRRVVAVEVEVGRLERSPLLDEVVDAADVGQVARLLTGCHEIFHLGRVRRRGSRVVRLPRPVVRHLEPSSLPLSELPVPELPSVSPASSTISASTTSSSAAPGDASVPPAAAWSASAAAYIAAPIFWLDSPSLVMPAWISSELASAFSSVALRVSTSPWTSVFTSSGIFSALSARNFSVV